MKRVAMQWRVVVAGLGIGVATLAGGCGDDDEPAKDTADVSEVGEVTPDTEDDTTPDGVDADDADDTDDTARDSADTVADSGDTGDDTADTADIADTVDTADTTPPDTIDPDATPAQRAILETPETARFTLPGLTGPVQVVRTEGSTPHIYAANRLDLARVLGFVQARDRFFFMDLQRRLGLGTIAELLGDVGLAQDVEARATGLAYITDRIVAHLSPGFAAYLESFAAGVNAYIDAVRDGSLAAPSETQYASLLGYTSKADMMKPFAVRDVVALVAVFMYSTNFESGDVGAQAAAERLDAAFTGATDEALRKSGYLADVFDDVTAMFPDTNSTPGFGDAPKANRRADARAARASAHGGKAVSLPEGMAQRLADKLHARMLRLGKDREAGFGSNVWAVSSAKTGDGSAILANDGHLELSIPPLGYGAALDTRLFADGSDGGRTLHQLGGWLGNFPVMVGGTNGDVAWGGVNPVMDITDWYREEIRLDAAGKPASSLFQGAQHDLVAVDETYVVANVPLLQSVGRTETWTRWTTFDGRWLTSIEGRPVTDATVVPGAGESVVNLMGDKVIPADVDGDGVIAAVSFDYVALDATKWPEALFDVGLSESVEEVREATRGYVGAALFTGAADKTGSILYTSYQSVPCRGYLPRGDDHVFVPGADPTRVIDGTLYGGFALPSDANGKADEGPGASDPQQCIVPFEAMPHAIDPEAGFVFNANNDPAGITDDGEERNDAWYIGGPWASVRANTIRRDLERHAAEGPLGVDDMMAIQANVESRLGEQFVPYLLSAVDAAMTAGEGPLYDLYEANREALDEAARRLRDWERGHAIARSGVDTFYHQATSEERDQAVATMIFNAWIRRFLAAVWDDEGNPPTRWGGESRPTSTLKFLASRGPDNPLGLASWNPATNESVFFDVQGTPELESSDALMVGALVDALTWLASAEEAPGNGGFGTNDMSRWLWGLRHQVRFESILASYVGGNPALSLITDQFSITTERLPLAASLPSGDPRKGLKWFPRGGDQWSVDAANPGLGSGDFTYGSGPAMRLVFKLKDGAVEGRFILPGGQSGIIDSPYFDDQARLWLANDYLTVRFTPADVAAGAIGRELYLPE